MNDENIVAINKAISRTNGLYQKWFQEHMINSYLVQTLNALYMEPELSQSKISDYYKIPRQTVNNAIQTLRRWGYIELLPDERDKRWKRIVFTESGTAYAQETITPLLLLDRSIAERMGSARYRQLGAYTNCNHGAGLAVIHPPLYRHIYKDGAERFARFARNVWGIEPKKTAEETALAGVEALADFIREIGLPTTFAELGIPADTDLRAVADSTNITAGCCKKLTHDEIYEIFQECV